MQGMSLDQQISFKQKVLKDSEKVLMLAASNLKTLQSNKFMEYQATNSLGEESTDSEIKSLNSNLEALDRQNHRDVL